MFAREEQTTETLKFHIICRQKAYQWLPGTCSRDWDKYRLGQKGTDWSDGSVLHLDCSDELTDVYV